MSKKKFSILAIIGVLLMGLIGLFVLSQQSNTSDQLDESATVQSNFYQYVNKDWIKKATIPKDSPVINAFTEIDTSIKKTLMADADQLVKNADTIEHAGLKNFVAYYQQATDFEQREKDGVKELKDDLNIIEEMKSVEDILKNQEVMLEEALVPFGMTIDVNPNDSNTKMIRLVMPSVVLGDVSFYQDEATKEQLTLLWSNMASQTLELVGYSQASAQKMVKEALAFDELLLPYQLTREELADVKVYNDIKTKEEISAYSKQLDFGATLESLVDGDVKEVLVLSDAYFKDFDKILSNKHFDKFKSWLLVQHILAASPYLTEDIRQAASQYELTLNGIDELVDKKETAYTLAAGIFGESTSVYYGQEHFGQEAKKDVTEILNQLIAVYKERLSHNEWLSEQTKKEAIKKLDNMTYRVGYPDKVSGFEDELVIDETASFYENTKTIQKAITEYALEHYSDPVDKALWDFTSYEVNAYYKPTDNSINFPAAILTAPFYDKNQSQEANYGGIGAVIGHELTHAFDSNGSLYDENGNLADWWTKEDKKEFEKRTEKMVKLFEGREIYGVSVNGNLTKTENTADAGGLSASLEALQKVNKEANLEDYFENWAKVWREKGQVEYYQYAISLDVHAPSQLRTNLQLSNLDAFYETYSISEDDAMYLSPEDRVSIW